MHYLCERGGNKERNRRAIAGVEKMKEVEEDAFPFESTMALWYAHALLYAVEHTRP